MKKILIVDDRYEVQELLKVTFEFSGYQLLFAENGLDALEIIRTEQPHAILMDIMMPNSHIDGLELCRRLKANSATADIAIILLSAKGQKEDIETGLAAGADDYVTKPFSPIALLQKVEQVLLKKSKVFRETPQRPGTALLPYQRFLIHPPKNPAQNPQRVC
jgi:two-component system, OmpR family, phosphate regulon response regulator PhoB